MTSSTVCYGTTMTARPLQQSRFAALDLDHYRLPPDFGQQILSPTLVIFMERVRANLDWMQRAVGGDMARWRPHVKTTKIKAVWEELVQRGVEQFKCATVREATHLVEVLEAGSVAGDVLIAYPLIGPALDQLGRLAERYPRQRLSVLCEDERIVGSIPEAVSIFVDVNPGMNRTGVPIANEAAILGLARQAGARFRGVHFYDGHQHGSDMQARRAAIHAAYDQLLTLIARLESQRTRVGEVITSGTPAFLSALAHAPLRELASIHRVSPGTIVFHDLRSEQENDDLELQPAALLFTRVISQPCADIFTLDAGSKSIAAEAGDPCAFVLGRPDCTPLAPSEEHLPVRCPSGELPPRGAEFLLIPRHVCPTTNLAEEVVLIEGGAIRAIVPVDARAHDVRANDVWAKI
jgi:D-serine deaminase-like pyridoxal phosphate-dependent protein